MKLSAKAVDHPRFVLVATVMVLLLALFAAFLIPVQRTPAISKAVVLVAIPYPDSQPNESENEIARKVEEALTELQSVDFIASTSLRGASITQVIFLDGVDPDEAKREVKDLIDRIRNELPLGREVQPDVRKIDFESAPLMLVTLAGPPGFDDRALKQIAEEVEKQISTVDGIANTQLFGGKEREIHVNVNPDLMTQYGLTLRSLRQALLDFNAKVPAGSFDTGNVDRTIRNESKFRGVKDIQEAIVSSEGGRVIRVSDVAEVIDSHRRLLNIAQLDGQDCATIIVNKESNINTLGAARAVNALVDDLRQQYPNITFTTSRDTSQEIWIMFRVLGSSALFGALLVLVILAWSMGLRISILVLLAIPFSSAVGLVFLYFVGIPVSNMVVFSFILALGMVVDGAIIVAENIHRHIERGEDPVTAAKTGIEEVGMPVIAADLTTIAAFLPMLLVPGIMGDFMGVMPKVVSVALFGSIMVDHFILPTLAARWYQKREPVHDESEVFAAVTKGESASFHPDATRVRPNLGLWTRIYAGVLQMALSNRFAVILLAGVALFSATHLFFKLGFEFFPASDRGQFGIKYELPLGYSIEETLAASKVLTEPLRKWEELGILQHYVTAVGSSGGLATRIENDPASGPEFGEVMVDLLSPLDRSIHEQEVINDLRREIRPLPGMKYSIKEIEDGPPGGSDVAVRLTGDNLEQLGNLGKLLADRFKQMRGTVDASTDYRDDNPELIIEPKPEVVGLYGLTEAQIAQAVQVAIAGDSQIQLTLDDEDVTLRLQLAPKYQRYPNSLKRLMVSAPDGRQASISELADIRNDVSLFSINRYERDRAVVAKCDVVKPTLPDDVFKVLREEILPELGFRPAKGNSMVFLGKPTTPSEGVKAEFTGENEERDKNFGYLVRSMLLGVVLIFAILVTQFNSFRQSLIVMLTVPLSFIGVTIGMWFLGYPFSLASFIGLVALTGIVVNDAIVMVDFTNQARERGLPLREALVEAGMNRLRPVLLTTVTTIGGLLPLLLNISGGAEFWQPLTAAIIFGLAFATVLTLIVIPVCYSLAYTVPESLRTGFGILASRKATGKQAIRVT
ncbi:efflux RND transporter permease subunit [Bythopirellula polymerisocia]|uniref:Multidrug resistance protein MdtC n=1 Tax=Bythopirellula polymerisocia TaxID=2528003 RepID=A0A5C6C9Z0_9BACT|nr:efflux RND transporter permease subunit [Bythopirellula polymerisocia]TWU20895.1 Multidrug resistance protein MdtC [Bythopirellula polymerisocia]